MREGGEDNVDWSYFSNKLGLQRKGQASSHRYGEPRSTRTSPKIPGLKELRRHEKGFVHLRDGGEFSDALIHVGSVSFPVHRNILSCCSPYFRALFTNPLAQLSNYGQEWIVSETQQNKGQPSLGHSLHDQPDKWLSANHYSYDKHITECPTALDSCRPALHVHPSSVGPAITDINGNGRSESEVTDDLLRPEIKQHNHPLQNAISDTFQGNDTSPYGAQIPHIQTHSQLTKIQSPSIRTANRSDFAIQSHPLTYSSRSAFSQHSRRGSYDSGCYEVRLQDVSPETIDAVINHAYGGQVTIAAANVETMLTAADRFQVASLIKECCAFLLNELNVNTCISIIKFSSRFYTCDALRKLATRFLLDNFTEVFQSCADFDRLSHQELVAILRADQLNVKQEETVLDAIIKWVLADAVNRQEHIPELVKCVRVGLMLPENMREFVDSWLVSSNLSSEFHQITLQVMESVLQCQKQQMTTVDGAMFNPRLPKDILFVIGGSNFGFPLNLVEAVDCRTFRWSVICPYDFAPRSYHGIVALNKDIYVIGGFSGHVYLSSCCKLRADSLTWENVTPMNTKRCYVGAVAVKGSIYTVGGYDGVYRLNSAEKFSTATNQWSFISPMLQQRSDAGVAVLNEKIYVCGGFNGMECIRSVELYDPEVDQWSAVSSMPRGRSGLGLAAYKGKLYAVGGFDGVDSAVRLAHMEAYDPETCQWTELEPMFHPRSNLAVEVLEDLLYAIGGYCGDRTTSAVECYDFEANSWFESGQLSHNRSALGACVVRGLPNTADILQRTGTERCALVHHREF